MSLAHQIRVGYLARELGGYLLALGAVQALEQLEAQAPEGAIGRLPDDELEALLGWTGESGALVRALTRHQWLPARTEP